MNVSYKGLTQGLPPKLQTKLDTKFAKLSKLLERRGEREAHVIVTQERGRSCAEVRIQFYDHQLVGKGADADLFTALLIALEKLEAQAVKQRDKWREKHRREDHPSLEAAPVKVDQKKSVPGKKKQEKSNGQPRVYRVESSRKKPITLDEAVLLIDAKKEQNPDYLVYRDVSNDRVSVLVRRRDGHFDLIES